MFDFFHVFLNFNICHISYLLILYLSKHPLVDFCIFMYIWIYCSDPYLSKKNETFKKILELKKLNAKNDLIAPSPHSQHRHLSSLVTLYILIVYLHVNSLIYWYFNILFSIMYHVFYPSMQWFVLQSVVLSWCVTSFKM